MANSDEENAILDRELKKGNAKKFSCSSVAGIFRTLGISGKELKKNLVRGRKIRL